MKFKVIIEPQPEGGYVVYVPALPGCMSQGETEEEALKNIKEAIELYLEVLEERQIGKTMKKLVKYSDKTPKRRFWSRGYQSSPKVRICG